MLCVRLALGVSAFSNRFVLDDFRLVSLGLFEDDVVLPLLLESAVGDDTLLLLCLELLPLRSLGVVGNFKAAACFTLLIAEESLPFSEALLLLLLEFESAIPNTHSQNSFVGVSIF